jgi:hypothetical protein
MHEVKSLSFGSSGQIRNLTTPVNPPNITLMQGMGF